MTQFLLAGMRPAAGGHGQPGLAAAARQLASAAVWHDWLRRWGLLAGYGLASDPAHEVRACLVVRASDHHAAERLALGWATVTGYRVAVLPLIAEPGEGHSRPGSANGE